MTNTTNPRAGMTDLVNRLRAAPGDTDAQAQLLLLASRDKAHALAFAEGMALAGIQPTFWADVATLIRLEGQSDEGAR